MVRRKTEQCNIRLTPEEQKLIRRAARCLKTSCSEFVLTSAKMRARTLGIEDASHNAHSSPKVEV